MKLYIFIYKLKLIKIKKFLKQIFIQIYQKITYLLKKYSILKFSLILKFLSNQIIALMFSKSFYGLIK